MNYDLIYDCKSLEVTFEILKTHNQYKNKML